MTDTASPQPATNPSPVLGFSHVQLRVSNVAASVQWYTTVLGLERFAADDEESYVALRHAASGVVVVLSRRTGPDDGPDDTSHAGPLDHLAFAVPDGEQLERWAAALRTAGIEHSGVVLELGKPSLQLHDPDGITVELVAPAPRRRT